MHYSFLLPPTPSTNHHGAGTRACERSAAAALTVYEVTVSLSLGLRLFDLEP